jgi:hypothetical protein
MRSPHGLRALSLELGALILSRFPLAPRSGERVPSGCEAGEGWCGKPGRPSPRRFAATLSRKRERGKRSTPRLHYGDKFLKIIYPRAKNRAYPSRALLVEGRQPVTPIGGASGMRGRRSGKRSRGGSEAIRWRGACAVGLVSLPPGRLRNPPWGYYGPCARCSLTARPDRRDAQARPGAEASPQGDAESRSRAPRGAPARVMGRRSLSVLGDRPCREAGHGVRRFRTSACRRPAPLIFSGSGNRQGAPAPFEPGWRSVG